MLEMFTKTENNRNTGLGSLVKSVTPRTVYRNVYIYLLSHAPLFSTQWTIQSIEVSRPEYWSGQPFPSPGDLPKPGIKPRPPALQVDSLPAKPQGKPKNNGVGSLSLLQGIFLSQELNWGLLHCREILYQLSYQGSPYSGKNQLNGWQIM